MEFFYTFQQSGQSYDVVWQDDIPSPVDSDPGMNCEQFASQLEVTVDQLWAF